MKPLRLGDDAELRAATAELLGVTFPHVRVCRGHTTPWRVFSDSYFARAPVVLAKSSRGFGGKSTLAAAAATMTALAGGDVTLLGASAITSGRLMEKVHAFCARLVLRPFVGDEIQTRIVFTTGATMQAQTASEKFARGAHPARLVVDEVDETDYELVTGALLQPQRQRGLAPGALIVGTEHKDRGTFGLLKEQAGKLGWSSVAWCWREQHEAFGGHVRDEDVKRARESLPEMLWGVEVEGDEPDPSARFFTPASVLDCFDDDEPSSAEVFDLFAAGGDTHPSLDDRKVRLGIGWDLAERRDRSIIAVLMSRPGSERVGAVYVRRFPLGMDYARQVEEFRSVVARFGGVAYYDRGGPGAGVGSFIVKPENWGRRRGVVEGFTFSRPSKLAVFNALRLAFERGEVLLPNLSWLRDDFEGCAEDDVTGNGHTPDAVVAVGLALAAWGADARRPEPAFAVL